MAARGRVPDGPRFADRDRGSHGFAKTHSAVELAARRRSEAVAAGGDVLVRAGARGTAARSRRAVRVLRQRAPGVRAWLRIAVALPMSVVREPWSAFAQLCQDAGSSRGASRLRRRRRAAVPCARSAAHFEPRFAHSVRHRHLYGRRSGHRLRLACRSLVRRCPRTHQGQVRPPDEGHPLAVQERSLLEAHVVVRSDGRGPGSGPTRRSSDCARPARAADAPATGPCLGRRSAYVAAVWAA